MLYQIILFLSIGELAVLGFLTAFFLGLDWVINAALAKAIINKAMKLNLVK
jgi:hypothetical protein